MPKSQTKGYHGLRSTPWPVRMLGRCTAGAWLAPSPRDVRTLVWRRPGIRPPRSGLPRDSVHSHRLGVQVGSTIVLGISLLFVLATHAGALRYGTIDGGWWWFFLVAIYLEAFLAVCCLLDTKLTRASRGPRAVRMGHAYQPCAHCTYWPRTPASNVPYVLQPQAGHPVWRPRRREAQS